MIMLKIITSVLERIGINYTTNETNTVISFSVKAENTIFNCWIELYEDINRVLFYSRIGAIVPESKRLIVSELMTRINYDLFNGNFEMDFGSGELRYKTSINSEGSEINEQLIENLIDDNILIADDYFYTLMKGITTDIPPSELLQQKETSDKII
jgi:hypothetical protein